MTRLSIPLLILTISLSGRSTRAEPPTLDYLFPAGGEQGTTVTLALGGKLDPWPVKIWSDSDALIFAPQEKKGEVLVQIPKEVPFGAHLIRVYNDEGASKPRAFLVDQLAEILETEENNNSHKAAQKIETTPVIINGRLERQGDVDSYAIDLAAGQWLIARVDGYGIASPIDPTLHLRDANGNRITEAYDTQNLDALLAYQAKASGAHILQIDAFAHIPRFDVRLFGSNASVYRLSIHTGPFARYTVPLAIEKGTKSRLKLHGWNFPVEAMHGLDVEVDATSAGPFEQIDPPASIARNRCAVRVSDYPQILESEPNHTRETAQRLEHPAGVSGHISPKGDEDWFVFDFKKDESVKFVLRSSSLGFPLDPVLSVFNAEGKSLANTDDADGTWDPALGWRAPEDGAFFIQIVDRYGMGGDDFAYHLEAFRPTPSILATVEKDVLRVEAGTTATLKATVVRRDGFGAPLIAVAVDLPEGIASTSAAIPDQGGEAAMVLTAAADAKPYSGVFRVLVLSIDPAAPHVSTASAPLEVELPVGKQLIDQTHHLWITVIPKKEPPLQPPQS